MKTKHIWTAHLQCAICSSSWDSPKSGMSKLYLDHTVHLCQHYICFTPSERPLALQLVSLQLINPTFQQALVVTVVAVTQWWCIYIPSQMCLAHVSSGISAPSQLCILLPYPLKAVDTELSRQQLCLPALKSTFLLLLQHLQLRKIDFNPMLFNGIYYSSLWFGENNTGVQML